jgi:hypothetical protein
MIDLTKVRLGKKAARIDKRTLKLARYLSPSLPSPPAICDYTNGVTEFGMMLNGPNSGTLAPDGLGCCTISACGHAEQIWTLNTGMMYTVPDKAILQKYETWCGYDPLDPFTDQGGVEIDVLNSWRKGVFWGHKIMAYADPEPGNLDHIKQSIYLFGGVYIGLQLPISAQMQDVWDVDDSADGEPGSWGGHAVFAPAYQDDKDAHVIEVITWGKKKRMTMAFWEKYTDEAHALLGFNWVNARKISPTGLDLGTLQSDLVVVTA